MPTTTYWLKEVPSNKLYSRNGVPIPFIPVNRDYAVLETADDSLTAELQSAVDRRIGGVIKIDETQYQEWIQKKTASNSLLNSQRDRQEIRPMSRQQVQVAVEGAGGSLPLAPALSSIPQPRPNAAAPQAVDPLVVPKTFTAPKIGSMPKPVNPA